MTKRVALSLLVLCACRSGGPSPTPTAATSSAPPPVAATTASAENEWHAFKPAPTIGSEGWKGDPRPMYEWVNGDAGATCTVHVLKTGAFYTCGGSVARFDAARLDFEPFRALPVGTNLPVEVYGAWPDDLWIKTDPPYTEHPPPNAAPTQVRLHAGSFTVYPTASRPTAYKGGYLIFLPEQGTGLPKLAGVGVDGPDFSSLERQLGWPERDANEWGYALDPKGPVWVFLRALDLATKKRAIGVLRWAPGETARFDRLPAPFDKGERSIYVTHPSAEGDRVSFEVTTQPDDIAHLTQAEAKRNSDWIVSYDGKKWSAVRKPDVSSGASPTETEGDGAEIGGYRMNGAGLLEVQGESGWAPLDGFHRGTLYGLGPSDVALSNESTLLRTKQPDEILTLTDAWGTPHPWPKPASADCNHPFVVLDVLERQGDYDAIVKAVKARPSVGWGKIPEKLASARVVEMRIFGRIVIGASFKTMVEAADFAKEATRAFKDTSIGHGRGGTGIYCVHPIDGKPFVAP